MISPRPFAMQFADNNWPIDPVQRALLSHRLCTASLDGEPLTITRESLGDLLDGKKLPNPMQQAANMVRHIGDVVSDTGSAMRQFPANFHAIVGARNREAAVRLAKELVDRNVLTADPLATAVRSNKDGPPSREFTNINLSLDGWEQYEAERRGLYEGKYGFIAMQFNEPDLDALVDDVLKPAVRNEIGYELVHMHDVGRAGVIDNILRVQIRDAAFVIADLTHDNNGAYWEAGFAEGLGKPVIYICEKKKFEDKTKSTHFDTNHCTTVPWSREDDEGFRRDLIATLRRLLNLRPVTE